MGSNDDLFLAPLPRGGEDPPPPAPVPPPDDPPTSPRGRPRWLGPLTLVAVVGALVTIATVLGDDDAAEAPEPATTTTERPAGSRRSTTTTVAPGPMALGPLLAEPTGTILVAVGERELVLVEVDTGVVRTVDLPGPQAQPGAIAVGSSVVIQRTNGVVAVPIAVDAAPLAAGDPVQLTNDQRGWPLLSTGPSSVWLSSHSEAGTELREITLDGHETGRRAVLPTFATNVVGVDGRLVVPLLGTLTIYDPDTGAANDIGHGHALAGHGDTLARLVCEALVCRLHLTGLTNGTDVVVDGPAGTAFNPWGPATFSPDARWLTAVTGAANPETLAVVDVATGRATVVDGTSIDPFSATFSADSRWLFSLDEEGALRAHRLGTAETVTIEGVDLGSPTALVAVPDAG